uniref:DUF4939 domain-containing protein n=1 Tax=Neolamprologus brichardi TaxID=32507 RepID=A0A3Q4GUS2_NEOBR
MQSKVSATPPAPSPVHYDRFLPTPKAFTGEIDKCAVFLTQCALQFRQQPQGFSTDGAKIAYIVQLLQDRALTWVQAVSSQCSPAHCALLPGPCFLETPTALRLSSYYQIVTLTWQEDLEFYSICIVVIQN